jgi:hypothetical protein
MPQCFFQDASQRIAQYNRLCLHYNLVADSVYRELRRSKAPFSPEYEPYLIAALVSFEMSRMMGQGLTRRYDTAAGGFAARLHQKLVRVRSYVEPVIGHSLFEVDISAHSKRIIAAYDELAIGGAGGLNETRKEFHVGATKILHFLNPELFMIIDSNVAKVLKAVFDIPYRASTQPGYSGKLYIRSLLEVQKGIWGYGVDRFAALEPGTPIMRVFDKIAFSSVTG